MSLYPLVSMSDDYQESVVYTASFYIPNKSVVYHLFEIQSRPETEAQPLKWSMFAQHHTLKAPTYKVLNDVTIYIINDIKRFKLFHYFC